MASSTPAGGDVVDGPGDGADSVWVLPVVAISHQRLTRELQKDPAKLAHPAPTSNRAKRLISMFSPSVPGELGPQRLDRLAVVLGPDRRLVGQHVVGQRLRPHAGGDLLQHRLGLALRGGLGLKDLELGRLEVLGDVALRHEPQVAGSGDLQGHLAAEPAEIVCARDKVGLASDLDHRPDPAARVHVRLDQALAGASPRALAGRGDALLAQQLDRCVHVAADFGQRPLAVHHARLGGVAQSLDLGGRGRVGRVAHSASPLSFDGSAGASATAGSASGSAARQSGRRGFSHRRSGLSLRGRLGVGFRRGRRLGIGGGASPAASASAAASAARRRRRPRPPGRRRSPRP